MVFRKNTVAVPDSPAIAPDAILTCDEVKRENPVLGSSDQRTGEVRVPEELEAIETTHARVAFTFSVRPCVVGLTLPTLTVEAPAGANAATCIFTRGGTVTETVWVRLLDDPCCAMAGREIIAVPSTAASSVRRSPTIFRASSYREPWLSSGVICMKHNMPLAL